MKTRISNSVSVLFIGIFLLAGQNAICQDYSSWLHLKNTTISKGYILMVQDSMLRYIPEMYAPRSFDYKVEHIELIEVRKEGKVLKGVLIGAAVGGTTGMLIGAASLPDCDEDDVGCNLSNFFLGPFVVMEIGAVGTIAGGVLGGIIGSQKIKIPINGNYEQYHDQKEKLRQYSIQR